MGGFGQDFLQQIQQLNFGGGFIGFFFHVSNPQMAHSFAKSPRNAQCRTQENSRKKQLLPYVTPCLAQLTAPETLTDYLSRASPRCASIHLRGPWAMDCGADLQFRPL